MPAYDAGVRKVLIAAAVGLLAGAGPSWAVAPAVAAAPAVEAPALALWTASGLERIQPADPPGPAAVAQLKAARGEWEPFQIGLRASGGRIRNMTAEASDLAGPAGTIPKENVTLYREHFVYLRRPSYGSDARPGLYPDALLPFVDPWTGKDIPPAGFGTFPQGAKYDAVPFDLQEGFDEVLWVDVFVPRQAKAGDYRGEVTVRGQGVATRKIQVTLTVWDFVLPETPTVRTHFGTAGYSARWYGLKPETDAFRPIEERYCETLALHRLAPAVPLDLRPAVRPDGSIDPSKTHQALKEFMAKYHVNVYRVDRPPFPDSLGADREKALRYLREMGRYLDENGWLAGAYAPWFDEPNDAQAYEEIRKWGALLHESGSKIAFLITEQTRTQDPKWGDLYGAVDIWVPLWSLHDEATAKERLAKGERLWSYTALCQGNPPTPWWEIDFPPLNYRVPLWQNWIFRMEGLLYWEAMFWENSSDPWLDEPSFRNTFNGEGTLLYPGKDAGIAGPITTIRLKNLRDGLEDFEYLALLEKAAGRDAADEVARKVARSWFDWEHDPAKLLAAREEIAARILKASAGR
jgi:hypothetical protein